MSPEPNTPNDRTDRRRDVALLHIEGRSASDIARALAIPEATVHADLASIGKQWDEWFGSGTFDGARFIGESLAVFQDIERRALHQASQRGIYAHERRQCLHTALVARDHQLQLLGGLGWLTPSAPARGLPRASRLRQLRELLTSLGLTLPDPDFARELEVLNGPIEK